MCLYPRTMTRVGAYISPSQLKQKTVGQEYQSAFAARCGACKACIKRNQYEWKVRTHYEQMDNPAKWYVVLNYTKGDENDKYLCYAHTQDFHKAIRHWWTEKYSEPTDEIGRNGLPVMTKPPYRYILTGEYGGKYFRPHYNILVFGDMPLDDEGLIYKHDSKTGRKVFQSPLLDRLWGKGIVSLLKIETVQDVNRITNYVNKGDSRAILRKYKNEIMDEFLEMYKSMGKQIDQHSLRKMVKKQYDTIKEKTISSQGLGFQSFVKRIEQYKQIDGVYINGYKCGAPMSWFVKLAEEYPEHRDYAREQYRKMLDPRFDDMSLLEKEKEIKLQAGDKAIKQAQRIYTTQFQIDKLQRGEEHYDD